MSDETPGPTLGDPAMPIDPGEEPVDGVPPDIAEAVEQIANRYGATGLDQLIEAAGSARAEAQAALDDLG